MQQELWQVMFSGGGCLFLILFLLWEPSVRMSFQNRRDRRLEVKANNLVCLLS